MCQSNQNLNLPPPPRAGTPWVFYGCLCPGGQGIFVCARGGGGAGNLNLAQVGHFNQKCQDFPV